MSDPAVARRVAFGVAGTAVVVSAITLLSRLVGFGRVFVFSSAVGTGCTGAAYTAANQIPNVLFEVVAGGALAGVVVPVTVGLLGRGRTQDADRAVSALLTWALVVLVPAGLVVAAAAGPLTALFLPGRQAFVPGLSADMLVIFAPQVVLYGAGVVLAGTLQAHGRFVWPALAPLFSSLVVIGTYVAYAAAAGDARRAGCFEPDRAQVWILAGGTTLGVVALTLPLVWPAHRAGVRLRPTLRLPDDVVPQARALALAGLGALLAQQVAVLATLAIAGRLGGPDVIVAVQYAQAVYLLPYAVLAVPLATVVFPRLSGRAAVDDRAGFAATASASLRAVLTVGMLGAAVLVAVAPAVEAFFVRIDAVKGEAVHHVGAAVTGYAPGLVGFAVLGLLTRALFATHHGRLAAWCAAAGWLGSIGFVLLLIGLLRTGATSPAERAASAMAGFGWGSSLGMTLAAALLVAALVRTAGRPAVAGLDRTLAVALVAGAAAAVLGRLTADALLGAGVAGGAGGAGLVHGASLGASLGAGLVAGAVALVVFGVGAGLSQRPLARELIAMRTVGE